MIGVNIPLSIRSQVQIGIIDLTLLERHTERKRVGKAKTPPHLCKRCTEIFIHILLQVHDCELFATDIIYVSEDQIKKKAAGTFVLAAFFLSATYFDLSKRSTPVVRKRGLEPPHPKAHPPQGCVYTNFTTCAYTPIDYTYFLQRENPEPKGWSGSLRRIIQRLCFIAYFRFFTFFPNGFSPASSRISFASSCLPSIRSSCA